MTAVQSPLHEEVLTAQSALDATHDGVYVAGYQTIQAMVVGSAGVASGAVNLEAAHTPAYAGTWVQIVAPVTVVADTVVRLSSVNSAYPYIRARITTVLAGGTVTVVLVGN